MDGENGRDSRIAITRRGSELSVLMSFPVLLGADIIPTIRSHFVCLHSSPHYFSSSTSISMSAY